MSCFNCYSARKVDSDLVDKILERGQKLRSDLMQSILNNDPLNSNIVNFEEKKVRLDELNAETNDKIKAFLQGDSMAREDEIKILETLKSMSADDLCKVTDRSYHSNKPCNCLTCFEYREKDLKCDLKRADPNNEITQKIQERYKSEFSSYLKFVDSVKVSVNCVFLNEAGDKKVFGSLTKDKISGIGQTFFLEYQIPEVLVKNHHKNRSKTDSGLDFGNVVRLCARRSHSQAISFKQTSLHDVTNLNLRNLEGAVINFKLSFRNFKQKAPISLGVAKFSFSSFEVNKNFTCNHELTLRLNENNPIVVGGLKVSIQLGCGRLYFGKEFLDAITNNRENSIALGSDDLSSNHSDLTEKVRMMELFAPVLTEELEKPIAQKPRSQIFEPFIPKLKLSTQKSLSKIETRKNVDSVPSSKKPVSSSRKQTKPISAPTKPVLEIHEPYQIAREMVKTVMFGFIYISEAQFSREVMNSYLSCQIFTTDEVANSRLVAFDSNPRYNFSQQIPLICDEDFLQRLRDNFMIVEFFEKDQEKEFLIGIAKLPLHQFYLTYRNPIIVKYLTERKLPVIGTDGWESIFNPNDGEVVGQTQALVALGTKEQIDNLELERGFRRSIVTAKPIATPKPPNAMPKTPRPPEPINAVSKSTQVPNTIDVAIQSTMEPPKYSHENAMVPQKDRQLQAETPTNSEPRVRSTSDLLDTLHKALAIDAIKEKNYFKAHVAINSALHLPSRRKCKSKKSKGRSSKHEDILPSTYVTFEALKGDLKVTPIVPKSTAPKWDFRCEVSLPVEYLNDNQKFLVFKVWRKSTNTTMTPNMNCDHVIGFATVDLTVLSAGLPSVQGWYNINDLSKKCNGQINIHVTPLENVTKYQSQTCCSTDPLPIEEPVEDVDFEPGELLGRALKRKFSELDEITQRLRLRLSKVTNDESDTSNDEIADEFERDINTLCVEDDFDLVDFEKEAHNFNITRTKEIGLLQPDDHLKESKQKIDQLLEKLSLFSGECSSRYVSGCSDGNIDAGAMLNELDKSSRPNLYSFDSFNRQMTEKFGSGIEESYWKRPEGEGNQNETKRD